MYEHTQRNFLILVAVGVFGAIPQFVIAALQPKGITPTAQIILVGAGIFSLVIGLVFCSMTIRVDDRTLMWQFGPGALRKTVPLAEIATMEPTTTNWYDGRGIHLTMRGWLYNIAGKQAVLIGLKSGKHFLLGTDEPATLVERIHQQLGVTQRAT